MEEARVVRGTEEMSYEEEDEEEEEGQASQPDYVTFSKTILSLSAIRPMMSV
ncbi:hypothetical protein LOAG_04542 [Loa loa]|uniref:Uncharacterized protein n=1 Tax=Loa loa TaxID=7209 RepID=A0A1S0U1S7_LOALO|nr:hypothetical protein LOAG_04542 [Loa loa]EFO23944.1 hypothetical protein LOAG_04542 [Loa loa]